MPRFVILWHESGPSLGRASHFDLLFEEGDGARAWFVENQMEPGIELPAGELPRHRLFYFNYEGPVPGDRGTVSRWDSGEYVLILATDDCFEAQLHGTRLQGTLRLNRESQENWRLEFEAAS